MQRYHSKYHRYNHHTRSPLPGEHGYGVPESATDPIASPDSPFLGDFHILGELSATSIDSNSGNFDSITSTLINGMVIDIDGTSFNSLSATNFTTTTATIDTLTIDTLVWNNPNLNELFVTDLSAYGIGAYELTAEIANIFEIRTEKLDVDELTIDSSIPDTVAAFDSNSLLTATPIMTSELGALSGVAGNIQLQINSINSVVQSNQSCYQIFVDLINDTEVPVLNVPTDQLFVLQKVEIIPLTNSGAISNVTFSVGTSSIADHLIDEAVMPDTPIGERFIYDTPITNTIGDDDVVLTIDSNSGGTSYDAIVLFFGYLITTVP